MGEYTRRLQLVGNRSYAISLPKKWVLANKLEKKREIKITEKNNNLVLSSKEKILQQNQRKVEITNLELIPSIVLLAYTKGYNNIMLTFKTKEEYLSAKPIILEILSHLNDYKITDETNNSVGIGALHKESNIFIKSLAKRMCLILNNMAECILQNKDKTKEILEKELDNSYHLSKRILYLCSIDPSLMADNEIKDIEEIFLWRLIFKKLENLGDILEKIPKKSFEKEEITDCLESLNDLFILNKKITIEKVLEIKKKEYNSSENDKIKELVIDILNNLLLVELNKELFV